jgi:hypothetical protein
VVRRQQQCVVIGRQLVQGRAQQRPALQVEHRFDRLLSRQAQSGLPRVLRLPREVHPLQGQPGIPQHELLAAIGPEAAAQGFVTLSQGRERPLKGVRIERPLSRRVTDSLKASEA